MKHCILITLSVLLACKAIAQNASLKHDTIYANKAPYALLKKGPTRIFICDLNGHELMEVHNGRIELKGHPGYVVNFLNDMKQAMVIKDAHYPLSFINEVIRYHLIENSSTINIPAEQRFIHEHPMPDGYTDVEQLIEY